MASTTDASLQEAGRLAAVYGLPTVDLHRILVNFALDSGSPEFKAPLNCFGHARAVADPSDRSIVAMNVDTPYSYAWLDLRGGPVVLSMPAFEQCRYVSAEIFDLYTYILGYVSPRTNGCRGGDFLISGPGWTGAAPDGMGTFACPSDLALVLVRTQLFDAADLANVVTLQDRMTVTPLSTWLGGPAPDPAPLAAGGLAPVDVRTPLGADYLRVLGAMLELMPVLPEDQAVREQLAAIGVAGVPGDQERLAAVMAVPGSQQQLATGLAAGMSKVLARCASVRSSAEIFGSREHFGGDHLSRAAGAYLGILGNDAAEYLGVGYKGDAGGRPFDGTAGYEIRFAAGQLPDVGAFWSITLYDEDRFLYPNVLGRYSLGSRDLAGMAVDADGTIRVLISHEPPPQERMLTNWLPCPAGPFSLAFRTYLPGPAIRDGSWTAPPVNVTPALTWRRNQ